MTLERQQRIDQETALNDKVYHFTTVTGTDIQLAVYQQNVRLANTFAVSCILPSVSQAKGLEYNISVDSATAAVTIYPFNGASYQDAQDWAGPANGALDAAEDAATYKSDGVRWHLIEDKVS